MKTEQMNELRKVQPKSVQLFQSHFGLLRKFLQEEKKL